MLVNYSLVSVVITTKNEQSNIKNCLESIKRQTWNNIEIIVVDNNSSDKTKEIAKQYTHLVYDKGPERSAQRNYGMLDVAKGEYLFYVDADMLLSNSLLENCVTYTREECVDALHISEIVLGKSYFSRVRRFERGFYDGTCIDGARFFTAKIFKKIGGFDEELFKVGSGEDWDLDQKVKSISSIKMLPRNSPNSKGDEDLKKFVESKGVSYDKSYCGVFHNESEFNLLTYIKKKSYYSKGFMSYIDKWGMDNDDVKKQFSIYYRYFGVFIENGKWKRLLTRPDLLIGMYFLRFLVGVTYIKSKLG